LKIPDENLKWNEATGHYEWSDINWDEFWNVIKGNGPCNVKRLAHHKKAHDEGRWVREAAQAYALKRNSNVKTA
jgi:ring-1,2-phenylacetyl-CoA epoxidase subunit PaaA